jgi:hypothetical protein
VWIGHTTDGGVTWSSYFQSPQVGLTRDKCTGGDPSVVYSDRDGAFYLSQLCFMRLHPESEAHVFRSTDGVHWTPSRFATVAVSNLSTDKKGNVTVDGSVFYDKELLAVDNNSSSPHYGRLYMTYVKFHMKKDGFSDYCPVQLAYTDDVDINNNGNLSDTDWSHTSVVPDPTKKQPHDGLGETANQWAMPVVDTDGGLDVAYAIEECNSSVDHGLRFTRSTNGGVSFSAPVTVDKAGQFADNPDTGDLLAPKTSRLPISPSLTYDSENGGADGSLVFAYQNNISGSADISSQYSTDFGATWSDAALISYDGTTTTPASNDQFFPALAADGDGTIHAIWFDNRNDGGNQLIETFHAESIDGGVTWSTNEDISDVAWDPNMGFFSSGSFIGDYNWIAAAPTVVYPVWTDGRNSLGSPNGQTDIFTTPGL